MCDGIKSGKILCLCVLKHLPWIVSPDNTPLGSHQNTPLGFILGAFTFKPAHGKVLTLKGNL